MPEIRIKKEVATLAESLHRRGNDAAKRGHEDEAMDFVFLAHVAKHLEDECRELKAEIVRLKNHLLLEMQRKRR